MAERVLRSPGVTTRELDLSAPGRVRPQGIPAGVVGTSDKGPAFVPVNFATVNDFKSLFGESKGVHFGAMAVNEWMRNARSGLFLRVLGVGNGAKADTNSVTTNAGFRVGAKMRDKDRTAASKALSSPYAAQETDGSADGPVQNPYSASGTPEFMTLGAVTGRIKTLAAAEIATLTIGAGAANSLTVGTNARAEWDGFYIVLEDKNDSNEKKVIWLDVQGNRTVETGGKINDGVIEIANLSAFTTETTHIACLDISGAANTDALASLIGGQIQAADFLNASGASSRAANVLTVTQQADGAGTQTQVTGVNTISVFDRNNVDCSAGALLGLTAGSQAGVTLDNGVVFSQTITFGDTMPTDDTLLTIKGEAGTSTIFGFSSDGTASGTSGALTVNTTTDATVLNAIGGLLELLDADDSLNGGAYPASYLASNRGPVLLSEATLKGASNLRFSWTASTKTVTITQNATSTAVLPLTAVTAEQNAPAPMGRTYFLGCDMFVTDAEQDYLGKAHHTDGGSNSEKILRGVLMFPSGVIPGLETNGGGSITTMPAAAFGTYASGKDQGAEIGKLEGGIFKMVLNGFTNTSNYSALLTGSFDPLSPIYFPKVLNTDPTKIQEQGHYLYAHYDVPAGLAQHRQDAAGDYTYLKPGAHNHNSADFLSSGAHKPTYEIWNQKFTHASTPWIMSQKLGNATKKLFKFHMLDAGAAGHDKVKVSIVNIQKSNDTSSDYGKFDVQIRATSDLDSAPIILQTFAGLSLNPSSERYIARVIGDQNTFFEFEKNDGKQKLVTEGLYPNQSQYVRVQVVDQIESGQMEATALPVGFQGKNHLVIDGASLNGGTNLFEPPVPYRQTVSVGSGVTKVVDSRFYWGTQYQDVREVSKRNKETGLVSLVSNLTKHFPSAGTFPAWVGDNKGAEDSTGSASLDADDYNSNAFSLENIWVRCLSSSTANAVDPTMWHEAVYIRKGAGGRPLGKKEDGSTFYQSVADGENSSDKDKKASQGYRYLRVDKDFGSSGSKKFYKFTVPMQGGFDGLDIFDKDKSDMSNMAAFREMSTNTSSVLGGPAGSTTAAYRKALDILAEKSDVDIQILATPGMRDAGITDYAIDKTEDRFDALYIMDIPSYDHDINLVTTSTQETSVTNTSQQLANRNIDTSFAATYFPDLVVEDGAINVVAPPSVAVLGALSLNDSVAHPWFAPAGFARGALSSTIETAVKLNRPNMDVLYDTDINPITSFPQNGPSVVVFGQKTMLQAQSALDRVNVRRLLIDVRRKVRTVANQILFEPNRESTLARFSSLVNPILGRIQAQQGVERYKVVIDTTTTTQQDVENNTIRGKIFLQPTRSIEFISLDFVVTNAGAEI